MEMYRLVEYLVDHLLILLAMGIMLVLLLMFKFNQLR
jgi:hypothetical protein